MKTLFDKVTHRRLPSPSKDAGTTECFCHGECGCGLKPFNSSESLHNSLNKNLDEHVRWFSKWVHDLRAAARANIFPRIRRWLLEDPSSALKWLEGHGMDQKAICHLTVLGMVTSLPHSGGLFEEPAWFALQRETVRNERTVSAVNSTDFDSFPQVTVKFRNLSFLVRADNELDEEI